MPFPTLQSGGCRLSYRLDGPGRHDTPPLIMIQGVAAFGTSPNPQIEILQKYYDCLSFDNRGTGASQPVGANLTIARMASDVLALMDHLGWDSAHVIGHSLGGLVALQLALLAKDRVRSLALLCSFARGADALRVTPALLWILLRLRFGPHAVRRQAFLELVLPPGAKPDDTEGLAARFSAILGHDVADMPPLAAQQVAAMRTCDLTSRLSELSGIPTLVINGDQDPIARPDSGKAIAAAIAGARYVEIAGGSHAFPILEADRCGALLLHHLRAADR